MPAPTEIPSPNVPSAASLRTIDALPADADCFEHLLEGATIPAGTVERLRVDASVWRAVGARALVASSCVVTDAIFERCDLANAGLSGAHFRSALFRSCRLTGVTLADARLDAVAFVDCAMDLASLQRCRVSDAVFERCTLAESDLDSAALERTRFHECSLRGANLARVRAASVDLRHSDLAGLTATVDDLRGCTLTPAQAPDILRALGLRVEG